MNKSKQISFSASQELSDAIEFMASMKDKPVSDVVRFIVWEALTDRGVLHPNAPLTEQAAKHSPFRRELDEIAREAAR